MWQVGEELKKKRRINSQRKGGILSTWRRLRRLTNSGGVASAE